MARRDDVTRVDIVTVRDSDYSNEYQVFVNGQECTEGPHGAWLEGVGPANAVRVEVWDFDFGRDDLTDLKTWQAGNGPWWTEPLAESTGPLGDLNIPEAVLDAMGAIVVRAREKYLR